ncbi:MAG: xanthine dehydrogenase family protein molybdopterin-binding subunit [Piscirickettsiaceae bacterium]|nr:xanthine dehydrogenase family protein molybdopterin-binding subunit [Piscirickettsiaceae bacterium]
MDTNLKMTRRSFLKADASLGLGLMLAFYMPIGLSKIVTAAVAESRVSNTSFEPNAFIRIATDNSITVIVKHLEMGQGISTGLPTLIAEELDADWEQIKVEAAPAQASLYRNLIWGSLQGTGASNSMANSFIQMRQAGATARAMLVTAAAGRWNVPASEVTVSKGVIHHNGRKLKASFGELVEAASRLTIPENITLKDVKDFNYIGKNVARKDTMDKLNGEAQYTIDMQRPDMLTAVVAHPPLFGAKVKSFDASKAKAIKGVVEIVQIPSGVAVLANGFWPAKLGRDALKIEWDTSAANTLGSDEILQQYKELAKTPGAVVRSEGDVDKAMTGASKRLVASFEFPYLAHAAMEPMDCAMELNEQGCEMWHGEQMQTLTQLNVSKVLGLKLDQIKINTLYAGGSFGRRGNPQSDFQSETAHIIKAMTKLAPVKLIWTREDDMQAGFYRPLNYHTLEAGLDEKGNITAWHHRIVGQSILEGTMLKSVLLQKGHDPMSMDGAKDIPYTMPNILVDLHTPKIDVPVLWWRSVAHTHTAFIETFIDELAEEANRDPIEFRRSHLSGESRLLNVLDLVVEKSGWSKAMPKGRGRGIAVHKSFNTYVAQVAEVTVSKDGKLTVDRVTCVVDCGIAVNPKIIESQMQGGIGFGLSAALKGAITLKDGRVEQSNFHDYEPIRMNEMPHIDVHIIDSDEAPSGVGEPGVPPIAPAVCNAIFMVTGKRIRSLPISLHDLSYA